MATEQKLSTPVSREIFELNWRFVVLVIVLSGAGWALMSWPLTAPVRGYISPLYSPTIFILPIPLLFRLTCYYYRKAYHRHIFKHPISCAHSEGSSRTYTGEEKVPFVLNNLHRYLLYGSIIILPFLFYDAFFSMIYDGSFALRLGSIVLGINAILLTLYSFSCHSLRHIIGGNIDCYSCVFGGAQRKSLFDFQTIFNSHHMGLAWASLIFVFFTDLYIRGIGAGLIPDLRII